MDFEYELQLAFSNQYLDKEIMVFVYRLNRQLAVLKACPVTASTVLLQPPLKSSAPSLLLQPSLPPLQPLLP